MEAVVAAYLDRLDRIDIWMTPTLGAEIPRIGVFGPDVAWSDQRDPLIDYAGYCWIDNFAGTPSVSLQLGLRDNGLSLAIRSATRPVGLELISAASYQPYPLFECHRRAPPLVGEGGIR